MDKKWQGFLRFLVGGTLGIFILYALFVAIIDPYNVLSFSPDFNRAPMDGNQRFSYPAIARNTKYDSLVIGTSTSRLFQPSVLNKGLESQFAVLSMNSAMTYEQVAIFKQFNKAHAQVKHLIIGVDRPWCNSDVSYKKFTSRPFPIWMYDDLPENDFINHFTFNALQVGLKQSLYILGLKEARYAQNGYKNFLLPESQYDLEQAQRHLYKNQPRLREAPEVPFVLSDEERQTLSFPALEDFTELVNELKPETQLSLVIVPYHHFHQNLKGTKSYAVWQECMGRMKNIARKHDKMIILDFMVPSRLTQNDENYWDPLHYRIKPSFEITENIVYGILNQAPTENEWFKVR